MEYYIDLLLKEKAIELVNKLNFSHIKTENLVCIRSFGTKTKYTLARIHTISKAVQKALSIEPHYVIEVIHENFHGLSEEEKTKTLIHELLHIPKSFGGGFRHHRPYVNKKTVEKMYRLVKD